MLHPKIERANELLAATGRPYACRVCGDLQPEEAKQDEEQRDARNVTLCFECYTDAGNENAHSDGEHNEQPDATCTYCVRAEQDAIREVEHAQEAAAEAAMDRHMNW